MCGEINKLFEMEQEKIITSPRIAELRKEIYEVSKKIKAETDILEKIREELLETSMAMASGNEALVDEELGDLLFAVVNLIRFRKRANSEELLRKASLKFESRFRFIEKELQQTGRKLEDCSFEEMEALWLKAKNALSPTENSSDEK